MVKAESRERRKKTRGKQQPTVPAQLWLERRDGVWQRLAAEVQDRGEYGIGVLLTDSIPEGQAVLVEGGGVCAPDGGRARGFVAWCSVVSAGVFRAGISLDSHRTASAGPNGEFEDYYETLEVNPNASFDVIHRIFRILAQRMHPDNPDSGNEEGFKKLDRAYRILSDPERRAAFDCDRSRILGKRWRIFDPESAEPGLEQEKKKRQAILSVLYNNRMRHPESSGIAVPELENLLAVPREHLEFPLWFLKEQGWIQRTDSGRHNITAKGVDFAESSGAWQPPMSRNSGLLSAAQKQ